MAAQSAIRQTLSALLREIQKEPTAIMMKLNFNIVYLVSNIENFTLSQHIFFYSSNLKSGL